MSRLEQLAKHLEKLHAERNADRVRQVNLAAELDAARSEAGLSINSMRRTSS